MIKSTGTEASIEAENKAGVRRPAILDIFIFALIALAAFSINALI